MFYFFLKLDGKYIGSTTENPYIGDRTQKEELEEWIRDGETIFNGSYGSM